MEKIYGIDLGTTNSLIGLGDKLISGLVPSVANLNTHSVGEECFSDAEAQRSFKTDMSVGEEGKVAILSSYLVLDKLVKIAEAEGHNVKDVVISVPAYFSSNQRQAVYKSAEIAGLHVRALINEPTAAALAYGKEKRQLTLVFDLGGGTFDISVIDTRTGVYDVFETAGLVIGGDNLDELICRHFMRLTKFKLHRASAQQSLDFKHMCTSQKIRMQKERKTLDCDFSELGDLVINSKFKFTEEEYIEFMREAFKPCVDQTLIVKEKSISYYDTYELLFVGGSTRCPYLREWVESILQTKAVSSGINPDLIVAQGAAYYASLVEKGEAEYKVFDVTKALGIGLDTGLVEYIIPAGSKLPVRAKRIFTNPEESTGLSLKLYQGSSPVAASNDFIGELQYSFDGIKAARTTSVYVDIKVNINGIVELQASEFGTTPITIKLML